MKTSSHATLLASVLICVTLSPAQVFPRQGSETGDRFRGALTVNGLDIRRSTAQPLKRYDGERLVLTTSVGTAVKDKFYGVVMILKYQIKQARLARAMTFTERIYLVEETHDFGLDNYFETSWSPDESGVWTDVLGLGDETPLPADYRRVIRQELYCEGTLFATHLITFTPEAIDFRPLSLDAGCPASSDKSVRQADIAGLNQIEHELAGRYRQSDQGAAYTKTERQARKARVRLRADLDPVPPWAWRSTSKNLLQ